MIIDKFKDVVPITEKVKILNRLLIKMAVEKTEKYNIEINQLQKEIDFFNYGIL